MGRPPIHGKAMTAAERMRRMRMASGPRQKELPPPASPEKPPGKTTKILNKDYAEWIEEAFEQFADDLVKAMEALARVEDRQALAGIIEATRERADGLQNIMGQLNVSITPEGHLWDGEKLIDGEDLL